jgi:uncharacterized protein (TIGR03437 family)
MLHLGRCRDFRALPPAFQDFSMKTSFLVLAFSMIARAAAPVTLANFPDSMVYAVQTDSAGNIYVAGFQGNFGVANPFVAKLSPSGQTLYSTTFASSKFGIAWAIAVDAKGAAYVFGSTNSPDFPVTAGALQTTPQGSFQGFVAKLDTAGKIVYSTFVGGATSVTPGLTSAAGLNSILVDAAGDVIITGQAGTNLSLPQFPPAPAPVVSSSESFVMKLDPTGAKILGAIGGIGGMIAADAQGNIYVTGLQYGDPVAPLAITPNAFQDKPKNVCGSLGAFFTCGYPYVAKLNPDLNKVLYATYVSGKYGGMPTGISVDPQGDAIVAGTTHSPDYPTTANAYEPQYIANAPPVNCFFIIHCVNLPPASGYLTVVNPAGTGLVYSTYFSGTQTDTIDFFASTPSGLYVGGNAGSANLPGFAGYPQQCLPQGYATLLSADGTEIGSARIVPGKVLAYDASGGRLIATTGTNVIAVDPNAAQTPIACILDSADFKPVTAIAPGQLLSLFGEFSVGSPVTAPADQLPTSLGGVSIAVNGIPSPLLYVGGEQINFQAPAVMVTGADAKITVALALSNLSDSRTVPAAATSPAAFLNMETPSAELTTCTNHDSASLSGSLPLAFNADGSVNTCLNRAAAGSTVSLMLNGLGATPAPVVTAKLPLRVSAVTALPGEIGGVWLVTLQIPAGQAAGGVQVSLTAEGVQVRDTGLVVWVK